MGFQNMETHLCRIFSFATWKKFDSELSCCFWRCRVIGVTYEALFKIFQKAKTNQCRLILIYITLIIIKFEKSFEIFPKLYLSDSSLNVATFHNGRRPLPGRGGWQSFYNSREVDHYYGTSISWRSHGNAHYAFILIEWMKLLPCEWH